MLGHSQKNSERALVKVTSLNFAIFSTCEIAKILLQNILILNYITCGFYLKNVSNV